MHDQNTFSLLPADLHIRLQDIIFPEKSKQMNKSTFPGSQNPFTKIFCGEGIHFSKVLISHWEQ